MWEACEENVEINAFPASCAFSPHHDCTSFICINSTDENQDKKRNLKSCDVLYPITQNATCKPKLKAVY